MKTTLDLPDDLLVAAKAAAVRRRTTLKAMVEHALRRELGGGLEGGVLAKDRGFAKWTTRGFRISNRVAGG